MRSFGHTLPDWQGGRLLFILRSPSWQPQGWCQGHCKDRTEATGPMALDRKGVLFRYGRNKHSVWNQKFWVDGGRQSNGRKDGEKFWIPSWRQGIYGELWTISMGKLQALLMGNLADQGDCRWGESLQRQIGVILIWSNKPWNLVEGMGMRK